MRRKILLTSCFITAIYWNNAIANPIENNIRWSEPLSKAATLEGHVFEARNLLMKTPLGEFMPTGDFYILSQMDFEWGDGHPNIWWPTIQFGILGHSPTLSTNDIDDDGTPELLLLHKAGANQTILRILRIGKNNDLHRDVGLIRNDNWIFSSNMAAVEYDGQGCVHTKEHLVQGSRNGATIIEETSCLSDGAFEVTSRTETFHPFKEGEPEN